jgi:DNA-binding NarL/FixJ family response regulator
MHRFSWKRGKLYIEIEPVIVIPIEIVPITTAALSRLKLTKREKLVFDKLLRGMSNKEIGNAINLSERTVKFHVGNLLRKFHVVTRGEAMALFSKK